MFFLCFSIISVLSRHIRTHLAEDLTMESLHRDRHCNWGEPLQLLQWLASVTTVNMQTILWRNKFTNKENGRNTVSSTTANENMHGLGVVKVFHPLLWQSLFRFSFSRELIFGGAYYKWNEYVTIAVNRNLSNCENSPKKRFSGLFFFGDFRGANAEATGSNPVKAPKIFFSGYFRNCLNCDSLRWSHTHFICIPAVHIISFRAYYRKEFSVSKWIELDNKNIPKHKDNSLKQLKTARTNSPWAYYRKDFCIWDLGALISGGLIILFHFIIIIYLFFYL